MGKLIPVLSKFFFPEWEKKVDENIFIVDNDKKKVIFCIEKTVSKEVQK